MKTEAEIREECEALAAAIEYRRSLQADGDPHEALAELLRLCSSGIYYGPVYWHRPCDGALMKGRIAREAPSRQPEVLFDIVERTEFESLERFEERTQPWNRWTGWTAEHKLDVAYILDCDELGPMDLVRDRDIVPMLCQSAAERHTMLDPLHVAHWIAGDLHAADPLDPEDPGWDRYWWHMLIEDLIHRAATLVTENTMDALHTWGRTTYREGFQAREDAARGIVTSFDVEDDAPLLAHDEQHPIYELAARLRTRHLRAIERVVDERWRPLQAALTQRLERLAVAEVAPVPRIEPYDYGP